MKYYFLLLSLFLSSYSFAQSRQDSLEIRNILIKIPEHLESGDILSLADLCTDNFIERDLYPNGSRLTIVGKKNLIRYHDSDESITNLFYNVKKMRFKKDEAYVMGEFSGDDVRGKYTFEFVKSSGKWLLSKATNYHE